MPEIPGLGSPSLKSHLHRRAQETLEVAQYNQTATILRYRETVAGDLAVGIAPTVAAATVAGAGTLADHPCSVSELHEIAAEDRDPGLTAIEHNGLRFAFKDLPATTDPVVLANTLLLTDFVLFQGDKYRIHRVGNDRDDGGEESNISWCITTLWVRG